MVISVALIDDQDVFCLGIEQLLAGDPRLAFLGSFPSVALFAQAAPAVDVVLLDDTLPDLTLLDGVARLQAAAPDAGLIILGRALTPPLMARLLQQGVLGFISKDEPLGPTLAAGIHRACQGKVHFSPDIMAATRHPVPHAPLSRRQEQLLRLIGQGLEVAVIARQLRITPNAVYAMRTRLRLALGVQTDAQLGVEALRRGLLDGE